ncbi:MAG: stage V sporulation protein SpoVM [Clostridia bacterium]|nr:stage V sporulation protein SpoVM [Clostridia bacterium]
MSLSKGFEGDFFMKVVVVKSPKLISFFLRRIFKIKKET